MTGAGDGDILVVGAPYADHLAPTGGANFNLTNALRVRFTQ